MPELPEVETVRDGLARHVTGRTVTSVEVRRDSAVRRHLPGPADFAGRLTGRRIGAAVRRGKFLWLLLDDETPGEALVAHLGMSGQLLVHLADERTDDRHVRARFTLAGDLGEPARVLDFVDQRTFGYLGVSDLVPTPDGGPGGRGSALPWLPPSVVHIARDLLDPALDRPALERALRARRTEIKRALLDQTLVSGIGNIYADEGLWRAGVHGTRATDALRPVQVRAVLDGAAAVMREALRAGGTSFDAMYVDVNGSSGWFDRELAVYGRAGLPCRRCGAAVVRSAFMNRSSYTCPRCQPRPRTGRRVQLDRRAV